MIDKRATFDFLAHPSCLGVVDPEFKTVELILDIVKRAEGKAGCWSDSMLLRKELREEPHPVDREVTSVSAVLLTSTSRPINSSA